MKIGDLSARTGIATSAIRFYESRGLLPLAERGSNGYRIYGEADVKRLQIILLAQSFGLSIDALSAVFADEGHFSKDEMLAGLETRLSEIGQLIRTLTAQRGELRRVRDTLAGQWDAGVCVDPQTLRGSGTARPGKKNLRATQSGLPHQDGRLPPFRR